MYDATLAIEIQTQPGDATETIIRRNQRCAYSVLALLA